MVENHSPYYPHPLEGPGGLITTVNFNGTNYNVWRKLVKTALKAKNKLGFIDGML